MKYFCLTLLAFFTVICYSQENSQFLELQKEIKENPDAHGKWLHRYMDYATKRVSLDGELPDMEEYYKEVEQELAKRNSNSRSGQWIPYGPFGPPDVPNPFFIVGTGRINSVTFHPTDTNTLYIGVGRGGVWKTTNHGQSWTPLTDFLPTLRVSDVAIDPNQPETIYASLGDYAYLGVALNWDDRKRNILYGMGIYKSVDGGSTWNPTGLSYSDPNFDGSTFRRTFVKNGDSNELLAAGTTGMWKSYDGGTTWTKVYNDLMWDIERLEWTDTLYASTGQIYNNGQAIILKSTDFGSTWSPLSTGINPNLVQRIELAVTPADPNYVYAVACDINNDYYGLFRSTDGGSTWNQQASQPDLFSYDHTDPNAYANPIYDMVLFADHNNKDKVVVGGINIWGSDDGGVTWGPVGYWTSAYGPSVHADQHQMRYNPLSGQYYLCGDGGIYCTSDVQIGDWNSPPFPTVWQDLSYNLQITAFTRVHSSKTNPDRVISGAQDNATYFYNGSQWLNIFGGDGMDGAIDPVDPNIIYGSSQYGNFSKSLDGGNTYSSILYASGDWNTPFRLDDNNNTNIVVASKNVKLSTNSGNSFSNISSFPVNQTIGDAIGSTALEVAEHNSNYIYTSKRIWQTYQVPSAMWRTKNNGQTWDDVSNGLPTNLYLTGIDSDPDDENHIWVTCSGFDQGSKVYESTDAGDTWINVSYDLPNIPTNHILVYHANGIKYLIVATDVGCYYKQDTANSWQLLGNGLPNVVVDDLDYNQTDNIIYAATFGRGIWKYDLSQLPIGTHLEDKNILNGIHVFPNPTEDKIFVNMDKPHPITYEVIDVQGRIITTGIENSSFDLNLNKGIFWLRIMDEQEVFIERIVSQ
ncbi:MAG: T9SS type A sorting domain-containing protein [Flavobacteriales bacterium]|nr:T9SS type A sorting domain-containing protein [Flavobacteriales bacterium]